MRGWRGTLVYACVGSRSDVDTKDLGCVLSAGCGLCWVVCLMIRSWPDCIDGYFGKWMVRKWYTVVARYDERLR